MLEPSSHRICGNVLLWFSILFCTIATFFPLFLSFQSVIFETFASRKCYHKILRHSFKSNSPRNTNHSNSHVPISCHTLLYLLVHFTIPQVWIMSSLPTGLGLYYKNMNTSEMTLTNKLITNKLHQYLNYNNMLTCLATVHSNPQCCYVPCQLQMVKYIILPVSCIKFIVIK